MARNYEGAGGLMDIGVEGFRVLEDSYGYSKSTRQQQPRQEREPQYGYNRPPPDQQQSNFRRNFNYYNSVVVAPAAKERVIDCNEAAKIYGGVLFKESITGRKKRSFFGFFGFSKAK